jgi:hypothetical protein
VLRVLTPCPASVADRRRLRSRRCAVPTAKHPRNRHTQQQSQSSTRAMAACQPRNQPPRRTRRSRAHTFRISQIPIAECAASSAPIPRGFFPWRLSDAGHWCMSRRCRWPASETLHKKPTSSRRCRYDVTCASAKRDNRCLVSRPHPRRLRREHGASI